MLYPKENRAERSLLYACRNCGLEEEAQDKCVYRNDIKLSVSGEQMLLSTELSADPTLPKAYDIPCPNCHHPECTYFQTRSNRKDAKMTLHYICSNSNCNHKWSSVAND
ncbi:DNA-directed RNA polymerase II core subunit rpb9 [Sorochytrium milnesiophthora]